MRRKEKQLLGWTPNQVGTLLDIPQRSLFFWLERDYFTPQLTTDDAKETAYIRQERLFGIWSVVAVAFGRYLGNKVPKEIRRLAMQEIARLDSPNPKDGYFAGDLEKVIEDNWAIDIPNFEEYLDWSEHKKILKIFPQGRVPGNLREMADEGIGLIFNFNEVAKPVYDRVMKWRRERGWGLTEGAIGMHPYPTRAAIESNSIRAQEAKRKIAEKVGL